MQLAKRRPLCFVQEVRCFMICSSAPLAAAVRQQLRTRCCKLAVCNWLRDLGRRTAMRQKRWGLAKKRASRLRQLPREIAGRMLRTNILPKAFWGHSHCGVSGKTLQRYRSHLARTSIILKKHGDVEVVFAIVFQREHDPAYKLRLQQTNVDQAISIHVRTQAVSPQEGVEV